jgi:hypothetical protein
MVGFREIYDETIADLRSKGFGGYCDRLHDYKNSYRVASINKPTTTPTKNDSTKTIVKNVEDAAAYPPAASSAPIEVIQCLLL